MIGLQELEVAWDVDADGTSTLTPFGRNDIKAEIVMKMLCIITMA